MNNSTWPARLVLLTALLALPVIGYGVRGALSDNNNDVRQWLPKGFRETREYDRFLAEFGSEEMAVVSWAGASLDDARMDRVADGLREWVGPAAGTTPQSASGPQPLFRRILTARDAVTELTSEPLNLSREQAIDRLRGSLISTDGKTAALVVMVNEAGVANRHLALDAVYRVASEQAGLSRDDLHLGGPTVESVSLDSESERSRYFLASISVLLALFLAWRCLRTVSLVMMVFTASIFCAAASVAVVYFTGNTMNLLLVMMPTLVYVLSLSAAVHIVNYYRDAVSEGGLEGAPARTVRFAWLPCSLSALTTAIGMGSLGLSDVMPVKQFGLYSAAGVLISLPVLLVFLPAMLHVWPPREANRRPRHESSTKRRATTGIAVWLSHRHRWVTAAGFGIIFVMGLGLLRLETSVKLLNLFSPDSRIIRDYTWLEKNLGPLVPIELVVRFDKESPLSTLQRLEIVSDVQKRVDAIDKVGGTISAATFAPPVATSEGGVEGIVRRRIVDRRIEQNRDYFAEAGYLSESSEHELWRVSARVEALNSLDYGAFMDRLVEEVRPVLAASAPAGGKPADAIYTGIVPLIYKAQRTLLGDLMTSFVTAFLIVGGVMVAMLKSLRAGLVAMVPNILPAVAVFGTMGAAGVLVDIGSMMTAGVALGIAVDDTIHYLSWFRRGLSEGLTRRQSIIQAYERCAAAMIQTTIICGLGLLVFSFSAFIPTSRFAWLMTAMLGTALLGDLLLLPALLTGRLGRYFEPTQPAGLPVPDEEALAAGRLQPA